MEVTQCDVTRLAGGLHPKPLEPPPVVRQNASERYHPNATFRPYEVSKEDDGTCPSLANLEAVLSPAQFSALRTLQESAALYAACKDHPEKWNAGEHPVVLRSRLVAFKHARKRAANAYNSAEKQRLKAKHDYDRNAKRVAMVCLVMQRTRALPPVKLSSES